VPRDYARFSQDKAFWYLTGVESPGAELLMDAESGREVLFLPKHDAYKEGWEGELWDASDEWVRELTGFEDVRPVDELGDVLGHWLDERGGDRDVWIAMAPWMAMSGGADRAWPYHRAIASDPLDGRATREAALAAVLGMKFDATVHDASRHLDELRWVKTAHEIDAMRRAGRAGAVAMVEAMRSTRPGVGEWELEALMSFVQVREGAVGPGYHAIVGSGANSNILHYSHNSRVAGPGEVVLIDYGPELDHYVTDITRTWPTDGVFTPRMAELYDAVLEAQAAGFAAARPGARMEDVDRACKRVLKKKGFGDLIRHGSCHYIGLEVHDVGSGRAVLEPGVAFTIEPGLYDEESGIGIRIEDVVVITEDGCEVLTGDVPRERDEVAALVGQAGLLQWLEEAPGR
jgi:Xaa-Pro aminopeptidase